MLVRFVRPLPAVLGLLTLLVSTACSALVTTYTTTFSEPIGAAYDPGQKGI